MKHLLEIKTVVYVTLALFLLSSCKDRNSKNPVNDASASSPKSGLQFPIDYKNSFTNYLSLDRVQNHDQIIRLFSNDIAMRGPSEDGKLPFGSVIVAEVYKAKKDEDGEVIKSILGRRIRGEMALIAVMERQKSFAVLDDPDLANEHWEFAAFKPDGSVASKNLNDCRRCHAPLKKTHHLFSYEHLGDTLGNLTNR